MAKKATAQVEFFRGRLFGLASFVLALLLLQSIIGNLRGRDTISLVYFAFALLAASLSWYWDRRVRLLVALSLGVLLSSGLVWLATR